MSQCDVSWHTTALGCLSGPQEGIFLVSIAMSIGVFHLPSLDEKVWRVNDEPSLQTTKTLNKDE